MADWIDHYALEGMPIFASLRCGHGTVIPAQAATRRMVVYDCHVCNQRFFKRVSATRGYGHRYIEVACKYYGKRRRDG
jgi:hypothetical protein